MKTTETASKNLFWWFNKRGREYAPILVNNIIASGRVVGRANIAGWLTEQPPMMRLDQTIQHMQNFMDWLLCHANIKPRLIIGIQGTKAVQ